MKKCKHCNTEFKPFTTIQTICPNCAIQKAKIVVKKTNDKLAKKRKSEMKERIKSLSDYKRELQTIINAIVREIDGKECISCGQVKDKLDAGHFYPTSTDGTIRFHLWNIHGQCRYCNSFKHGSINEYNAGILKRYGQDILNLMHDLPVVYRHKIEKEEIKAAIPLAKDCLKELRKIDYKLNTYDKINLRKDFNNYIKLYETI
jgi:hypothetical protein